MVAHRIIATLVTLLAASQLIAQYYAPGDTTYEYPNKGTYYHDKFHGRKTANGEVFDQNKFTAAHWKIKLGTLVLVTNQNTGLQVIVKVNDRCPKRGVFDLSHRAATAIGIRGMQPVIIRQLPDCYKEKWAAQDAIFDSVAVKLPAKKGSDKTSQNSPERNTTAKDISKKADATGLQSGHYTLILGTATNHGDAYSMIQKLPEFYQDKVIVEQVSNNTLLLSLDINLDKIHAEELTHALKHAFPNITLKVQE